MVIVGGVLVMARLHRELSKHGGREFSPVPERYRSGMGLFRRILVSFWIPNKGTYAKTEDTGY